MKFALTIDYINLKSLIDEHVNLINSIISLNILAQIGGILGVTLLKKNIVTVVGCYGCVWGIKKITF